MSTKDDPAMVAALRACLSEGQSVRSAAAHFAVSKSTLARKVRDAKQGSTQDAPASNGTGVPFSVGHSQGMGHPQTITPTAVVPEVVRTLHPDLKPAMQRALQALLEGSTKQEAAEAAGVSPASLTTWTKPAHLMGKLLREIQADRARAAKARMANLTLEAVDTLAAGMHATKPMVVNGEVVEVVDFGHRNKAANDVLDRSGVLPKLTTVETHNTGTVGVTLTLPQIEERAAQLRAEREQLEAQIAGFEGE